MASNAENASIWWRHHECVRSRRCVCLVTWYCYHLIAKPSNKTTLPSWPDPNAVKILFNTIIFSKPSQRHWKASRSAMSLWVDRDQHLFVTVMLNIMLGCKRPAYTDVPLHIVRNNGFTLLIRSHDKDGQCSKKSDIFSKNDFDNFIILFSQGLIISCL